MIAVHPKTILITGASTGIGAAIASQFAAQGNCRLILTGRRERELKQVAGSLAQTPCHLLRFDVRDPAAVASALGNLPADFADIDVLVNNAGAAFGMERAQDCTLEDWDAMVDTNIKGLLHVTHAVLPKMTQRQQGHVINMGSIAGTYPYTGGNVYGATKAFVYQFSQNLRADLLGKKLRVTLIAPGLVETDFFEARFKGDKEKAAAIFNGIDALQAEDIAAAVVWCTEQPPHVNISVVELMPTCQAPANITVHRQS